MSIETTDVEATSRVPMTSLDGHEVEDWHVDKDIADIRNNEVIQ